MKQKKLASLFLATVMMAALFLGGCGDKGTENPGSDTSKDSSQEEQSQQPEQEEESEQEEQGGEAEAESCGQGLVIVG